MHKQTSHYGWEIANGQVSLFIVPTRGREKVPPFLTQSGCAHHLQKQTLT
eukprot:01885.XXX_16472_16621_1 [CDS] Oithona nana genome sequencing.